MRYQTHHEHTDTLHKHKKSCVWSTLTLIGCLHREETNKLNQDLTWKLDTQSEELDSLRALAGSAVKHQLDMLSGMFKVSRQAGVYLGLGLGSRCIEPAVLTGAFVRQIWKDKALELGFKHWTAVLDVARQP